MTISAQTTERYQKRLLYLCALSTCLALLGLKGFVIPYYFKKNFALIDLFDSILGHFLTATISFLVISVVLKLVMPSNLIRSSISLVDPRDLKACLEDFLKNTYEFTYYGHLGRWTRSVTLPFLAKESRSRNSSIYISLIIINPNDSEVCSKYALYRKGLMSASNGNEIWTADFVRVELIATIISGFYWAGKESLLKIEVSLVNQFSVFRYDFSSNGVIVTTEEAKHPALMCDNTSPYYATYREDVELALLQSKKLLPPNIKSLAAPFSAQSVKNICTELSFETSSLSDSDFEKISTLVVNSKPPY
jgi:hypothetical protein